MSNLGGIIGGTLGTLAGTALGSPTTGASIGTGLGQAVQGAFQKKKAKGMLPSPEDVGERALLNTLRRRRQVLSTGTAYNPQIVAGQQMAKAMQRNAFAAGSPVNQGMYSNLMSQALANITQQTSQDIANTLGIESQTIKGMADTKRDLTLLQRAEGLADAAENQKASLQNLASVVQPKGEFTYNELGETPEEARKRKAAEAKAAKDAKNAAKTEGLTED